MTAAHKTLPLPSYVEVRNLEILHKGTARVPIPDIMPAVALKIKQDATTDSQQLCTFRSVSPGISGARLNYWTAFTTPGFPTSESKLERSIEKNSTGSNLDP
jgi:hypothetical protein